MDLVWGMDTSKRAAGLPSLIVKLVCLPAVVCAKCTYTSACATPFGSVVKLIARGLRLCAIPSLSARRAVNGVGEACWPPLALLANIVILLPYVWLWSFGSAPP